MLSQMMSLSRIAFSIDISSMIFDTALYFFEGFRRFLSAD